MGNREVSVPIARLLDPDTPASAKLVWAAHCLTPGATPAELEATTGFSRPTVLVGLAGTKGWKADTAGPRARLPAALLADRHLGAQAKLLYGTLQATTGFRGHRGRFTYPALTALTHMCRNTLRQAIAELVRAGWVQLTPTTPFRFALGSPQHKRSLAEAAVARRRLKRAMYSGEALMQEYLSLLIDSDEYTDNARPGFLVNPQTKERLELDRFYTAANVAFEFHGAQHDRATGKFTQQDYENQHFRDLIKAGLCLYRGIHLVIVRAEDLTVQGMLRKIGHIMPLRRLGGHEPLIDLLEEESFIYRAAARTQ